MKAVVKLKRGKGNIALMDVEKPVCGERDVLIRIRAVGVCGTDYHIYTDEYDTCPPMIVGHEFSGEIVEVGKEVKNLKIGERVVCEVSVNTCGVCRYCKTGNYQICPSKKAPGTHIDGAYAEFIKMPPHLVHKIPDNVTFEEAALVEPSAIVAHSLLERTKIEPEDFVVVMGPGPIGLLAAQMARIYGARAVMVVGTDIDKNLRLPLANKLKADYVVNASETDIVQKVLEMTNGMGADLVVECSGAAPAINAGIELLRKHGRMCVIGIPGPEKIQINWKKAVLKAINVIFNFSSSSLSWDLVLSMLNRNVLDVKSLISHKEPLENWETVFKEIEKGNVIKAVLIP
jgi:L-iditol 2-dehydrogenase